MQTARWPSATMSMAPVTAMTAPVRAAKDLAKATARSRVSSVILSDASASTPLVVPLPTASVRISEMLPRMTVGFISRSSRRAVSVRRWDAPAPTGSSTTGRPSRWAVWPARSMEGMVRLFRVPMFRFSPAHREVMSSTSAASSAMMGDAPQASTMLAQSLTVT